MVVRDGLHQAQFHAFVGQQAQAPARVPRGRRAASQRRDFGALRAADARRPARARTIPQDRRQALALYVSRQAATLL